MPTLPWTSPHSGAFLLGHKMMRSLGGHPAAPAPARALPACRGCGGSGCPHSMGNCAWRVNGRVLSLVLDLFRDKGCCLAWACPPRPPGPEPPRGRQAPKGLPAARASPADKAEMRGSWHG